MTTRQQFQLIRKVLYDIECAEISFLERTTEPAYSFSLTYLTAMQQLCAREKKRERLPLYGMKRSTAKPFIIFQSRDTC